MPDIGTEATINQPNYSLLWDWNLNDKSGPRSGSHRAMVAQYNHSIFSTQYLCLLFAARFCSHSTAVIIIRNLHPDRIICISMMESQYESNQHNPDNTSSSSGSEVALTQVVTKFQLANQVMLDPALPCFELFQKFRNCVAAHPDYLESYRRQNAKQREHLKRLTEDQINPEVGSVATTNRRDNNDEENIEQHECSRLRFDADICMALHREAYMQEFDARLREASLASYTESDHSLYDGDNE
eukprot:GEZU01038779.1.p1 GENE.GEZU01038779.1~~GEZU01038779.1.p1  ORF type:complete len:242 (-),score=44.39 GEZU01038779.1:56-781(-)